jgi:hypothetical protein
LLVNLTGTWALRPEASTAIPNLFLASDYVRTYTDLATMEGANEAARRAVNAILDATGFDGARCDVWPLHELEVLAPWRLHDASRYRAGLPWDSSLVTVASHVLSNASPLLAQVAPLLAAVAPFANPVADVLDLTDDAALEDTTEVRTIQPWRLVPHTCRLRNIRCSTSRMPSRRSRMWSAPEGSSSGSRGIAECWPTNSRQPCRRPNRRNICTGSRGIS